MCISVACWLSLPLNSICCPAALNAQRAVRKEISRAKSNMDDILKLQEQLAAVQARKATAVLSDRLAVDLVAKLQVCACAFAFVSGCL